MGLTFENCMGLSRVTQGIYLNSFMALGNDTIMGSLLGKAADGISNVIDTGVGGVKKVGVLTTDVVVGTGDVVHKMASETAGVVTTTLSAMPLVSGAMPLSHSGALIYAQLTKNIIIHTNDNHRHDNHVMVITMA